MEHPPVISIVLPTYNGSKYIKTSIESCLNQTFKDFELVIVNDCSTDNTASIIQEYAAKDNRIVVIYNAFNKKLPLSLNTGFDAAKGKYHTWTSDDNYYAPDALETMLTVLEKDSNIDLVYCDYFIINDSGEITGVRKFNNVYEEFTNWLGCGACFLYKKEIYAANNGYNPSAFMIEDYDFFVRAFTKFNFYYLPANNLYYYREHPGSLTSTQGDMVNDLSKIMVERQINNLANKLPSKQLSLLYRKFAVYNAVQKNNIYKYKLYLSGLWSLSKKQTLITIFYVPIMKLWKTFTVSLSGFIAFIKLLSKK
jgi:glycosyltransferase involved in cell wall biosynthesis